MAGCFLQCRFAVGEATADAAADESSNDSTAVGHGQRGL